MKVRNPYGEPVEVPDLGGRVVAVDEVVEIDPRLLPSFLEAGWVPADTATKKAATAETAEEQG